MQSFLSLFLESCDKDEITVPQFEVNFSGKVIILGAGAAGLTAGYLLQRNNIDFQIIEAAPGYPFKDRTVLRIREL